MRICRHTGSNYLIVESVFVSVNTFWVFTSINTLLRAPDTLIWRHDALSPRKGTLLRQFGLRMARRYPVVCRRCLRWSGTFTQIPRKKTALPQPKMGIHGNDTMIRRNNIIFLRHNMPF